MNGMKQEKRVWEKSPAELFRELQCGEEGLTAPEARARLERYGPNELASGQGKSVVRVFLEQFRDFLVALLLLAALIPAGYLLLRTNQVKKRGCGRGCATCGNREFCHRSELRVNRKK